jgi:hypothetical protein
MVEAEFAQLRAGVPLQILGDTSRFQDAEQSGGNVQAFLRRLDALIKTGSRIAFTEAWVAGVVLDGDTPESKKCVALLAQYHFEDLAQVQSNMPNVVLVQSARVLGFGQLTQNFCSSVSKWRRRRTSQRSC